MIYNATRCEECNTINMTIVITTDIDSDGTDSDDIEGFNDPSNSLCPIATPQEKYLWRLLKGKNHDQGNVAVKHVEGRRYSALRLNHIWQVTIFVSMVAQYEKHRRLRGPTKCLPGYWLL